MWIIVSIVSAVAYGGYAHTIVSNRHFDTQETCDSYRLTDAAELTAELHTIGIDYPMIASHCEVDEPGEPA
jgi:hypothetical protein